MRPQGESGLIRLNDEILSYLRAHPQAADTVEGIVEWWLSRHLPAEGVERVQAALDELVARGLIAQIALVDGTVLYAADGGHHRFCLQ